ncbi:MAG: hypothetical protein K940chlam9_01215 [Chlamydiae bacterium]|nr:hypothetical protein [Chlamydiota bacterium]
MKLAEITTNSSFAPELFVLWANGEFCVVEKKPKNKLENRETLARLYTAFLEEIKGEDREQANRFLRTLWRELPPVKIPLSIPRIIREDGFLGRYAIGAPIQVGTLRTIWEKLTSPIVEIEGLSPLTLGWNSVEEPFHDIDATPPGLLSKFSLAWKLKKDEELLRKIHEDLKKVAMIENAEKRCRLTLALLSHAAAYRELEGRILKIPSFRKAGEIVIYACYQHLIEEGVKTISLVPTVSGEPGIYLCQGTELWPSQPSVLGSILANFAYHGSATAAYAHSWRRIHKQLRDLKMPIVAGHSMGGALAMQIGLYSHTLVDRVFAFNPPVPNQRDYDFYHQVEKSRQEKIQVITNLDDFAFWRIGSKIIGKVTIYLGKKRWRYYAVGFWDCLLLLPAFVKFFLNVWHAFPAHQNITELSESWVGFPLSKQEIEKEHEDRPSRFDYLHFLPKLYDPFKTFLRFARSTFGWRMREQYLRNEIEILALHERDLIDTQNEGNREEIEVELKELRRQKEVLLSKLRR